LFQNLATDIAKVQTLGGIVILGGDFNARITALPDTIDTTDVYELLHVLKLAKTK
jgi:endonuclease/exonuclease/phosphatase (EEP) superfamily protein YafD